MPACPFCAIAQDEDPAARVLLRTQNWVAFFPLTPATRGHTLVIPTKHVEDYWQLDADLAADVAVGALRVGQVLRRVIEPEGMNLITSAGHAAEQTVAHVHLHVLPRWRDDRVGALWPPDEETSSAVLDRLAKAVRTAF